MPRPFCILYIDDDPVMRELVHIALTDSGMECLLAEDAVSGLRMAYQSRPDAIILDVMMPQIDGFETCQRLREMTDAPIIFLTGHATTTEDVVRGFGLGADEYISKPFNEQELVSRIKACLRRSGEQPETHGEYLYPCSMVVLDCSRHEVTINDQPVYLCPKEFEVLELLIRHAGQVLSRDAILARVWGSERVGEPDLVKQYVYRLRKKMESVPSSARYIHSVRGGGYYFEAANPG